MSQYLLDLYSQSPDIFSDEEVDQLESFAKDNNISFMRNPNSMDFSIGRTLKQTAQGFASGMTTLKIGEAPRNEAERIANSVGHLFGFIGIIPGAGTLVSGGTKLLGAAAKTSKAAGIGSQVLKASKVTGQPARFGGVATGISVPMMLTNIGFEAIARGAKALPANRVTNFFKDTSRMGNLTQQALHLGTASAISSQQEGWQTMMNSFVQGTVAGGVFAGIPNFKTLNSLVKNPDPVKQQQGLNGVRALAGALANTGLVAGTSALSGMEVPPSEYIYQALLGGYFGYKTQPFEQQLAGKRVGQAVQERQERIANEGEPFYYLTKDNIKDYQTLPTETKSYIDAQLAVDPQTRQLIAQLAPKESFQLGQNFVEGINKKTGKPIYVDLNAGVNKKNQLKTYELESVDASKPLVSKLVSVNNVDVIEPVTFKKARKDAVYEIDESSIDFTTSELQGDKLNRVLNTLEKDGFNRFEAETNLIKVSKSFNRGIDQAEQLEAFRKLYPQSFSKIERDLQSYIRYNEGLKEVNQIVYVDSPDGGIKPRGSISLDNNVITKMKHNSLLDDTVIGLSKDLPHLQNKPVEVRGVQELQYYHVKDNQGKFTEQRLLDADVFINSKTGKETNLANDVRVDLALNQEAYILSSKKAKGTLQVVPFLVPVSGATNIAQGYAKSVGSLAQYKKLRNDFSNNIVGTQIGTTGKSLTKRQANNLYDRMFASNIRLLENMNGLPLKDMLKANKKNKKAFVLDVVDFNNRMQLFDAAEPGLSKTRFINNKGKATLKDSEINANGDVELKFALINSKNQNIVDKVGQEINAHVDGIVFLRKDLFKKMLDEGGFPNRSSILKGTIASKEAGKGLLLGKLAYFEAPSIINKSLVTKKIHGEIYDTAVKQTGLRKFASAKYLPINRRGFDPIRYIGKDYITKIKPEDIRLNLSVYENPQSSLKPQKVVQQLLTTPSLQQLSKKSLNELYDYVQKEGIDGDPVIRKKIEDHLARKKVLTDNEISKINIDDIPIDLIASITQQQTSSRLYSHVFKKLLSADNQYLKSDIQTQAQLDLLKNARRFNASGDRIITVAELNPAVTNHKWVTNFSDQVITKYIIDRVISPKVKYSGKAIGVPNNIVYRKILKTQEGEMHLGNEWKNFVIRVGDKEMTLGNAYAEYTQKKLSKARKAQLEDAFEFVVTRVPIDALSGIRALKFKGFTGDRGAGIVLNGKDMIQFSGMDLDIDSVFLYQSMPKSFRKQLKKNKDEFYQGGKFIDAKSKQAERQFTVSEYGDKKLSEIRSSNISVFDPSLRVQVGQSVYESAKSIGVAVNTSRRARAIYEYETNRKNKTIQRDKGKGIRETGRSITQLAADSKDYAGLVDNQTLSQAIYDKIYRRKKKPKELWDDPEIGNILKVDASIRGRRWNRKLQKTEKARIDDILQVINDTPLPEGSPLWLQQYVRNMKKFEYDFNVTNKINTRNLAKQTNKLIDEISKLDSDFDALIFKNVQGFSIEKLNDPNAQRRKISDALSQLVSIKRLAGAIKAAQNKGATKEQIFDAINFAEQINYASYFTVTRLDKNRLTPEALDYINKTNLKTPNDVNIALKERLDRSSPEIKNLIQEKLINNILGPTPQEINISVVKPKELPKGLQKAVDAQKGSEVQKGYVADLQRFGFVSELVPDSMIKSWFKDYSNVFDAIQNKPTVSYARQLIAGTNSKYEAVRTQAKREDRLNLTMNLLRRTPLKNPTQQTLEYKKYLSEIFNHHREAYTEGFEAKFLGTAAMSPMGAEIKIPRSLEQLDATTMNNFIGFWRTVTNGKLANMVAKKGMPLKWKDFFKFPTTISEQHLQYDLKWAQTKAPVLKPGKGAELRDLQIPISNSGKLQATTQASLEMYDSVSQRFNEKLIKKFDYTENIPTEIKSDVISDAVALIEIKGADAQIYKDAHAKALSNRNKYKGKKYVLTIRGDNRKLTYEKLVNQVSKDMESTLGDVQEVIYGRRFANKKEYDDAKINVMDESNPNHEFWNFVVLKNPANGKKISNINIDATISKRISSNLFQKKMGQPEPFIHYARLSDIIIKLESFTSKNSNKLVRELNSDQIDAWFRKNDKKFKFRGAGYVEGYFPHMNHLPTEVQKYMERKIATREAEAAQKAKELVDNANSVDGGLSDNLARLVLQDNKKSRRLKENDQLHGTLGMRSRPQNLLTRDKNDPTPGYRKSVDVLGQYHSKIYKATTNHMLGLAGYKTIRDFHKGNSFGKDNVQWERFMKLYLADNLGYPSIMPQKWADDPTFAGNKKSLYYKFTDKYIFEKMNKNLPGLVGEKGKWYKNPEDLGRKLNHFSNMEGKYQLYTLLFNTRTYFNNVVGGNFNSMISAGFDNMYMSYGTLDKIVPKAKGDPIKRGYEYFRKIAEEHGAVETFLTGEFNSNPIFAKGKGRKIETAKKELRELRDKGQLNRKNAGEILRRAGISQTAERGAGFLMRVAEERLRTRSYWMHYKKAQEVFSNNGIVFERDDPILVKFALKGSQTSQYLYNNAQRPAFSRTSFGRVFSRFQLFTWNSIRLRKQFYKAAKGYGFNPDTQEFDQFKRMMLADMFVISLASYYPASLFENVVPPPYNILQDLSDVAFGSEKERERAFFGTLPAPFNVVQAVSPPSARLIMQPLGSALKGDWERFYDYYIYNMMPGGMMIKTGMDIMKSPLSLVNKATGFPLYQIAAKVRDKRKLTEEEKKAGEQN